jgi:drug/metabolite transporter (DMT)-like permease
VGRLCAGRGRGVESEVVTGGKDREAWLTEISLILAAIFWGTNYAATKFAALSIPPLSIVAVRFIVGGLLMYCVLRIVEPGSRLARRDVLPMAGLGCLGVAVAQTSFTFGVSMTSAANTGLIFATAPVWGLLLGLALGLERPTWSGVLGVGLSILGVGVVFWEGLTGAGGRSLVGDVLVLLAAVGVGFYTVLSMRVLERHSPLTVATYLRWAARPCALHPVLRGVGVGRCRGGGLGGGGLLCGLRYGVRLLGLADGNLPYRGKQGSGLPVPHHHHGGSLGRRLL